jgi:hypothetical protein
MKITRGRGVAEQVARARRVARSKHDGATSGKRAACFGLSLKTGKKRVASASDDVPDAENPEEIEDALPASPVPPSSLGSAATHQDRELEALAESIKRMYAGYVNEFVKEVRSGFFFGFGFGFSFLSKRSRRSNKRFRRARNTGTASRAALPRRCTRHPGCGT